MASSTTLGERLTLLRQIGEGGMARIFLARARGIGGFEKLVVVKQILPRLAEDAEFIARFLQEAQLAATLDHPNIATVYDVGHEGGAYFYSMEYVRGRDLHRVMLRARQVGRRLALGEIVAIVTGLCAGLHHAHTHKGSDGQPLGIVHRDVSPSNVLLSFEGAVKLTDFGVAKARTGMVSTDAGTLRGKLGYMSPEQCRGEALDRRSDVYAVGVLLWEMLAGRRLHRDENEVAIIHRIAREQPPSPRSHRPDLGDDLERIVARALECSPARRFPSAHALQAELEEHARQLKLATSARTIAALMHELFPDETSASSLVESSPGSRRAIATRTQREAGTLPTVTVAPAADLGHGPMDEASAPTDDVVAPTRGRSSWAGVSLGLGLGVLLGGGGLYVFASGPGNDPPTSQETPASTNASVEPKSVEPEIPSKPEVPVDPREAQAHDAQGVEAPAANETPAHPPEVEPTRKRTTRRRKPRTRRAPPSPTRELNLDSPLPPRSGR